jgi:ABC-type dipeptide/oligopeptide/nickel transport system permease subunit
MVVIAGLLAPILAPYDPVLADVSIRLQGPSSSHWLGTDELGRDLLSRLLYGATLSLRVGSSVVLLGVALGVPLGAISGYFGGGFDLLAQRVVDTIQAFPGILLIILVVALVGPSLELATLALGMLAIPAYARLTRGQVLLARELVYVEAARSVGCSDFRVLALHILPNTITPVIVQSSLQMGTALLQLAGLSFLGLGAQAPTPEWGAMLSAGRIQMRSAPHVVIFPGLAVSATVLGLNLIGDALRDALDTRASTGHKT